MQNNAKVIKWGTMCPIIYQDEATGNNYQIHIKGDCVYNTNQLVDIADNLRTIIIGSISSVIQNCKSLEQINESLNNNLLAFVKQEAGKRDIIVDSINFVIEQNVKEVVHNFSEPVIIDTNSNSKDGQNKCPNCGATEISLNFKSGKLRCLYCRSEFENQKLDTMVENISELEGQVVGSGAQDIVANTNDIMTFKCSSCGAEVVIDTSEASQARCHWCRSVLSINQQIPNGSIPDVVLPFGINKDDAKLDIERFVNKRKFFAHPEFKKEFTTDNIMGVYFPYMLVDVNAHANLVGQGEHTARVYTRGSGDKKETYYDADIYNIERDFDIVIEGLTVESSIDKLDKTNSSKTTNVINAVMPFDIENAVKWNANYLKGFTSERRDANIEQLKNLVEVQSTDIARFAANESLGHYDRGVKWEKEELQIKGQQWKSAYLPVWLYSYQQVRGDNKLLHYVAVNARTRETMGSVPIHIPKLILFSFLFELLGIIFMLFVDYEYSWLFLSLGFIFFFVNFFRYRNFHARHKHELETKKKIDNMKTIDNYIKRKTGLSNSSMYGANNHSVNGGLNSKLVNLTTNQNSINIDDKK